MITFDKATKKFGNDTIAIDNVSFDIDPGELVVITGPSGSGKTTLMRLLIREYLLSEGDIKFEGSSLNEIKESLIPAHRRKVGVVFQDYKLLPELNVWENIALPLSIINKSDEEIASRVTDLLKLVSLTDKALVFPGQLSGGEAQRISIARALATAPSLVFADEPTGNLDKESSLAIAELLRKINKLGTTLLFATHDSNILENFRSERTIRLDKGKLVEDTKSKKKVISEKQLQKESPAELSIKDQAKEKESEKEKQEEKQEEKQQLRFGGLKIDLFTISKYWPFGKKEEKSAEKKEQDNKQTQDQEKKEVSTEEQSPLVTVAEKEEKSAEKEDLSTSNQIDNIEPEDKESLDLAERIVERVAIEINEADKAETTETQEKINKKVSKKKDKKST